MKDGQVYELIKLKFLQIMHTDLTHQLSCFNNQFFDFLYLLTMQSLANYSLLFRDSSAAADGGSESRWNVRAGQDQLAGRA